MNKHIALIDADSLIFYSSKETIEDSILSFKSRIDSILDKTESDKFILFLTGSKNFRYTVFPDYKAHRKKRTSQPLKYLKTLKAFAIEEYNACLIQELEADDCVAYYKDKIPNTIVCSPDKDVLHQVIGNNYNYGKDEWVTTTIKSSDRFLALQLLMGDATDNIPGIKEKTKYMKERFGLDNRAGIGESTANKILDIIDDKYKGEYSSEILSCYNSKYTETDSPNYKGDEGFNDYTMNRYLLQLNLQLGRYNKILENYNITQHINTIINSSEWLEETKEDKTKF